MTSITEHPVPASALEQDIAILGQKGSGKSFAAKGLVERLLDMGRRVIIIDPLNHWYGLKAMADGSPGYPIIVVGGPNADIELDPHGGGRLGEVLAESDRSFIVDISDLVRSEIITFTTAFLTALYKNNREALWLVAEEADIMAPQNPAMDGTRAMCDAMDQIARRGRQRGFRLWTITQRPARLAKDCLTQASTLLVMRIRSPQDRSAAEDWIKGHAENAQTKEVIGALASLDVGEGFVYAPDLDLLEKVRFPMIKTLDTSGTPQAGEKRVEMTTLATVDVEAIRRLLRPPEKAVAAAEPAPRTTAPPKAAVAATPRSSPGAEVLREARHRSHVEGYQAGHAEGYRMAMEETRAMVGEMTARIMAAIAEGAKPKAPPAAAEVLQVQPTAAPPPKMVATQPVDLSAKSWTTNPAARKLMGAFQRYSDVGLTWAEACVVAGMIPGNGYMYGGRKALLVGLAIYEKGGRYFPTLIEGKPAHLTRTEFKALWGSRKQPAPRMFDCLCEAAGEWVSITDLAAAVDLKPGNGFWYGGLSQLRDAGLIEQEKDRVRVVEFIGRAAR